MKMTRKLIPAFVMLIVSAIMLSTASYAWFANSTTVTASGMTVKANTNVKFLQISASGAEDDYGASANFDPIKQDLDLNLVHAKVAEDKTVTWYTASAAEPDSPTADNKGLEVVDNISTANAVLLNTFYVKMSSENSSLTNLKLTNVEVTNNDSMLAPALRVLVIAKNSTDEVQGVQVWDVGDSDPVEEAGVVNDVEIGIISTTALVDTIENGAVYTLDVYIYFDGEDVKAYTDRVANASLVKEQAVTLTFSGT